MMAQGGTEPSMEEILSSIKRIIAEDSDGTARGRRIRSASAADGHGSAADAPPQGDDPDVLELTDPVGGAGGIPAFAAGPLHSALVDPQPAGDVPADAAPAYAAPPAPETGGIATVSAITSTADELISTSAAEASRQALAALSRMVVRPEGGAGDLTLEALVREMLRPMLKDWLDARLPEIVNAAVAREVARISGRGI
jgi:cell pole-organizing protein PopZ